MGIWFLHEKIFRKEQDVGTRQLSACQGGRVPSRGAAHAQEHCTCGPERNPEWHKLLKGENEHLPDCALDSAQHFHPCLTYRLDSFCARGFS